MVFEIRRCEKCRERYTPKTKTQKMCQNPCTSKKNISIEKANLDWGTRPERKYKLNRLKNYTW